MFWVFQLPWGQFSFWFSISWWTFSHSPANLPPPGGHWGNVRKSTWDLWYPCISTIYLCSRQYLYFLPSSFKGTSLLHCNSSNLLISSDIRGKEPGCSGLTQLLLVSPQRKPPLRQRNTCVSQRAWNERIPEIHSLRTQKYHVGNFFYSSEFFFHNKKSRPKWLSFCLNQINTFIN